jgi:hypothetical protein
MARPSDEFDAFSSDLLRSEVDMAFDIAVDNNAFGRPPALLVRPSIKKNTRVL